MRRVLQLLATTLALSACGDAVVSRDHAVGSGGSSADAGPQCAGCVAIALGQEEPEFLAVDAMHLYWLNAGSVTSSGSFNPDGSVMRATLDGKEITMLSQQAYPFGLVLDDTRVYWGAGIPGNYLREARAVPKSGGSVTALTELGGGLALAVDATSFYFSTMPSLGSVEASLERMPKSGGAANVLAPMEAKPLGLIEDETRIYWVDLGGNASTIPTRGSHQRPKIRG